jgi:hypothetical protein
MGGKIERGRSRGGWRIGGWEAGEPEPIEASRDGGGVSVLSIDATYIFSEKSAFCLEKERQGQLWREKEEQKWFLLGATL